MSELQCPLCGTIRPPNARFCPNCGVAYQRSADRVATGGTGVGGGWDPPLRTAIRFGFGFALGAAALGLIIWSLLLVLFVLGLQAAPTT